MRSSEMVVLSLGRVVRPRYGEGVTFRDKTLTALMATVALLATTAVPAQAALDSGSDPVPSFNGRVLAVAYAGTTVYVGGDFTAAVINGKLIPRNRLAAVDAVSGELLPWAPAADARVKAIATAGSSVYVAGEFSTVNGQKRDSLARISGTTGTVSSTFKHNISGKPYALAVSGKRLYLGGAITAVNSQIRTGLAAFNTGTGVLDTKWKPVVDDQVEALTAASGRIYTGGKFHKVNNTSGYNRLVALDPSSGAIVTAFKPKPAVISYGIAVTSDTVYSAHGGQGGKVNAYSLTGKPRWTTAFDGDTQAVTVLDGTVYVGGHFDNACRTTNTGPMGACLDGADVRVKLAALDAGTGALQPWTADANGIEGVLTLAVNPALGTIAAGGSFTTVNGATQKRFAQFS